MAAAERRRAGSHSATHTRARTISFGNQPLAQYAVRGVSMNISIIVPVLNEAALIRKCLVELRRAAPDAEMIVVDGNSSDPTADYARPLCDRVLKTTASRARQMNAGAQVARGDVLWFI